MHSPQVTGELVDAPASWLTGILLICQGKKKEGNGKHWALAGPARSWLAASPSFAVSIVSWL